MATTARLPQERLFQVEKLLASTRQEMVVRLEKHKAGVLVEQEPDDEGAQAERAYSREFALTALAREQRTLVEIEQALTRLKKGEYGICSICGKRIPEVRLRVIPWARLCVPCAEGTGTTAGKGDKS